MYVSPTFRDVMRTRLLVTGALLASSCFALGAHATPPTTVADGPLAASDDVAWMLDLEAKMNDNLQQGKSIAVDFATADQVPGQVVGTSGWGDSGLWTGVYLGGESLRYATAKAHLASLHANWDEHADSAPGHADVQAQIDFWTAQRDQAMTRARTILAAEHRDINIAEDWNGTLKVPPSVSTNPCVQKNGLLPGCDQHAADFGGGVIPGEKGMIMRACTEKGLGSMGIGNPSQYADHPIENNDNRVFEITWTHGDGKTYNCETSPSRDTYAGLTFGLLTAYDMVDDEELRTQIRGDLQAMGDFLVKYGWNYPRPHGYVSANHDFDGAFSPLFVYVPMARLNLTNAVRHVLDDGDDPVAKAKWDGIWAEELATEGPQLAASMQIDAAQPNDGYYKFNLHHLTAFNLLRTLTGPERTLVAQAVSVMDNTTHDDVNAHFEAIIYSQTGDQDRLSDAVTHLREWKQYRVNSSTTHVDNTPLCGHSITCVPTDQYELGTPAGDVTWFPGQAAVTGGSPSLRAARPLPVSQRTPSDFIWQRPPTDLEEPREAANHREAGIDYLTPYWMLRYYTEVEHPAQGPLPVWAGPPSY
jgi:hypothetical protein